MNQPVIVAPVAFEHTHKVSCFPPWYVQGTGYPPALATYEPLINGEETFRAVHQAIAQATKTVDIICWGFQPSMFLLRSNADDGAPCIGELLAIKAREGVQVRVLGWEAPFNASGFAGEANLPGKSAVFGTLRPWSRALQHTTEEQYAFDKDWYSRYAVSGSEVFERLEQRVPMFVSRGFDRSERQEILHWLRYGRLDEELRKRTRLTMIASPTHHQKTVLVDYEVPDRAVGFVMGHNLLDEYWDTNEHSAQNRTPDTKPHPHQGPRGTDPRQDISSRVTGPILRHLHDNFATAWRKETRENLLISRQVMLADRQPLCSPDSTTQVAQILVTQMQEAVPGAEQQERPPRKREIEQVYLQAVNNATRFIYIENQYFRWPALAEKIKDVAKRLSNGGKDPGVHGALHLFVITNASRDCVDDGAVNTQRMLESLGRAETIPNVTKLRRAQRVKDEMPARPNPDSTDITGQLELKAWEDELRHRVNKIKQDPIEAQQRPGLKVHVCSLVAADTLPGQAWASVYIHSKLMIVDDVFTTQGSTNINTRSMQVDSELNIAHDWASVTRDLRRKLWGMHTAGKGVQDDPAKAFEAWRKIIAENKRRQKESKSYKIQYAPFAPLVEFYYEQAILTDKD